jgi:hypothetical protein
MFPVQVRKLEQDDKGNKKSGKMMSGYAPKFVEAESSRQAYEIVLAELIKAEVYDPADPMVRIEPLSPFAPAREDRY